MERHGNAVRVRTMLDVHSSHSLHVQRFVHIEVFELGRIVYVHKKLAVRYQRHPVQNGFEALVIQSQPRGDMRRREQVQGILRDSRSFLQQADQADVMVRVQMRHVHRLKYESVFAKFNFVAHRRIAQKEETHRRLLYLDRLQNFIRLGPSVDFHNLSERALAAVQHHTVVLVHS